MAASRYLIDEPQVWFGEVLTILLSSSLQSLNDIWLPLKNTCILRAIFFFTSSNRHFGGLAILIWTAFSTVISHFSPMNGQVFPMFKLSCLHFSFSRSSGHGWVVSAFTYSNNHYKFKKTPIWLNNYISVQNVN